MDNPALLQGSRRRQSAQAVINHTCWSNQSLLMFSISDSESEDYFLSGIRLIDRYSDSSDNDSGPIDDIEYESYDDGSEDITLPDPVDSDSWIEQWDVRSEEDSVTRSNSIDSSGTSNEDSEVNVIIHYDSGDESTTLSSSDTSHEDKPVLLYHSFSTESEIPKDPLDMVDETYESCGYDEAEDCWEDSVSFGGTQHNLNVGSVEQPWTVYLETAPEDENEYPFTVFFSGLSFVYGNGLQGVFEGILGCAGESCALGVRPEDQNYGAVED
jgi:hypothetical protein